MSLPPARPESPRAGFMLIEVIVASTVAVILLAALLRVFGGVWDLNGRVREEAEAIVLARSVMEGASQRTALVPGAQAGQTGRYSWEVSVTQIAQAVPRASASEQNSSSDRAEMSSGLDRAAQNSAFASRSDQETGEGQRGNGEGNNREGGGAAEDRNWTLYRIQVAVLGPSGRRTNLETLRLGQTR